MANAKVEIIDQNEQAIAKYTIDGQQTVPGLAGEGTLDQVGIYSDTSAHLVEGKFRVSRTYNSHEVHMRDSEGTEWLLIDPNQPVTTPPIEIGMSLIGIHIRDTDSEPATVLFKFEQGGYRLRVSAIEPT